VARSKRRNVPTSTARVTAVIFATPRKLCSASITAFISFGALAMASSIALSRPHDARALMLDFDHIVSIEHIERI
jgi:hypothetical protein